jgi:hypothetical protein
VRLIAKYQRIESIVSCCKTGPRPAIMWITSSEWDKFAKEVATLGFVKPDGDKPKPDVANFQWAMIGKNLKVINAGTNYQGLVDDLNAREAPIDFAHKRDTLRTG